MPAHIEPGQEHDTVVAHFSGTVHNVEIDWHDGISYYAIVANDSTANLTFRSQGWLGHYGQGALYLPYGIFTHRTVSAGDQTGLSFYVYGYPVDGPKPLTLTVEILPSTNRDQAYDILFMNAYVGNGSEVGGGGGDPCPPNPPYPYRDTVVDSSSRQAGIVPRGRPQFGATRTNIIV
jgi:hypothetical protein